MTTPALHWIDARDPHSGFPPVELALNQPNGLLAAGGDLGIHRLLDAYSHGIFPWYNAEEPILWWSPDPRVVFLPGGPHVSRRFARTIRRHDYALTLDRAFAEVIQACAAPRGDQHGTWLSPQMQQAYIALHEAGFAHSAEVWRDGQLIGGIYGVALGKVFFGESMFSRQTNASKLALYWLAQQLWAWDYHLLDGQVGSDHLYNMGATDLSRPEFIKKLQIGLQFPHRQGQWNFDLPAALNAPQASRHLPQV